MALAVGAGFIVCPAYRLIERSGVAFGEWSDVPILIMIACYATATLVSRRRYQ